MQEIKEKITKYNSEIRRMGAPKMVITPDSLRKTVEAHDAGSAQVKHGMMFGKQSLHVTDRWRALGPEGPD